jgi:hypothetical protein
MRIGSFKIVNNCNALSRMCHILRESEPNRKISYVHVAKSSKVLSHGIVVGVLYETHCMDVKMMNC